MNGMVAMMIIKTTNSVDRDIRIVSSETMSDSSIVRATMPTYQWNLHHVLKYALPKRGNFIILQCPKHFPFDNSIPTGADYEGVVTARVIIM